MAQEPRRQQEKQSHRVLQRHCTHSHETHTHCPHLIRAYHSYTETPYRLTLSISRCAHHSYQHRRFMDDGTSFSGTLDSLDYSQHHQRSALYRQRYTADSRTIHAIRCCIYFRLSLVAQERHQNCTRKGLALRSTSIVVVLPCPGKTTVSSGNVNIFALMLSIS